MTDKARQRRKALATELGVNTRTAANIIRSRTPTPPPPPPTDLAKLLAELHVDRTFAVLTGRTPATAAGSNVAAVVEQSRRLADNPMYFAETGTIQITVTRDQHILLVTSGAADDTKIQIMRSFTNDAQMTFSERCRKCRRWIWCREGEHSGTCFCGAEYRVVFDLAPVYLWTLPHNARCMDCGVERIMHPVSSGVSPWHVVNDGQSRCNHCHTKANPPRPFQGLEVSVDGAPAPRHFKGECPTCKAPMSGVIPAGKSGIEFQCDSCAGKFTAKRRDPIREELLKEALGTTTCHGCGCDLGMHQVPEGQPIPTTRFVDGFHMCSACAEKQEPMLAASRNIVEAPDGE